MLIIVRTPRAGACTLRSTVPRSQWVLPKGWPISASILCVIFSTKAPGAYGTLSPHDHPTTFQMRRLRHRGGEQGAQSDQLSRRESGLEPKPGGGVSERLSFPAASRLPLGLPLEPVLCHLDSTSEPATTGLRHWGAPTAQPPAAGWKPDSHKQTRGRPRPGRWQP